MDAKKTAGKIFSEARKEYRANYYQENREALLAKQKAYIAQNRDEINHKQRMKRMEQRQCYWCHKSFDAPGNIIRYKRHYFCDESCLGEYLVDKEEENITVIWHDTEENMRICAEEAKAEW